MTKIFYRRWQILLTFLSFFVLGSSYYFQYIKGLQPCPLCLMQRICVFLLFGICFAGAFVRSLRGGQIVACFQFLIAAGGLFFAGRQLWLQSLPAGQAPACMPELDVLIRYFPWRDVLHALFLGSGDCADITWQWLGLPMAGWAALYFLGMLLVAIPVLFVLHSQLASKDRPNP
ncbi:Disulfide oxidoreductase [Legionella massiliensis]|uniref:Disulfide bond formation protein B n=1 Tax=Legionella massiliensis TaxID=1034943 RepID=A0A078L1P8_9GAMM|nr:disulfide bond formation protein B [Legionella massiliensis]CDZ77919.1 Disulfide oxidoreductase [Legionella massiliensis]CEE13657.1 Disulfide bond formation protein B [Legionella massiliensis]